LPTQPDLRLKASDYSLALRYMLLSTLLFAWMNVSVKYLSRLPPMEIVFFRGLLSSSLTFAALRFQGIPPWGNNKKRLIMRGVIGSVALILFFWTLQKIPLADAVTIQYTSPIFTTLMGVWLAGERVSAFRWFFIFLSFMGVVLIQGFDPRVSTFMLGVGLTASLFTGWAYTLVRKLTATEHPLVIVLYFPLVALPLSAVFCLFHWVTPRGMEWIHLLSVGISTQIAQYCITNAYQRAEVSRISPFNYLGIVYAVILGIILFDEKLNVPTLLGIGLVLSGIFAGWKLKK
jgi:drug/metabolite transporter (DMT)-like permease